MLQGAICEVQMRSLEFSSIQDKVNPWVARPWRPSYCLLDVLLLGWALRA